MLLTASLLDCTALNLYSEFSVSFLLIIVAMYTTHVNEMNEWKHSYMNLYMY